MPINHIGDEEIQQNALRQGRIVISHTLLGWQTDTTLDESLTRIRETSELHKLRVPELVSIDPNEP